MGTLVLFAIHFGPVLGDPFGESRDGHNGAVWATTARSIRAEGLIESRLGAEVADGIQYANHPPLISLETALGEAVLGEHRIVTRGPAWAGTLVAFGLLWLILRELGFSVRCRAVSLLVGAGCPMVLAFGSMLDTPVTSLPIALAALLIWLRTRGNLSWSWARAVSATLCMTAGWQAGLLVAATVGVDLLQRRRRPAAAGAAGLGLGLAAVLAWQQWVYGSFSNVVEQLRFRTGIERYDYDTTVGGALARQADWLVDLLTPLALVAGAVGLVILLRSGGQRREVAAVATFTVLGYTTVLSGGAYFHEYWSYWAVVLVILGAAAVIDRVELASDHGRISRWWASVAPLALALAVATTSLWRTPFPLEVQEEGIEAVRAAIAMESPEVAVYGLVPSVAPWATYETGKAAPYLTTAELRHLGATRPDQPVLTSCRLVDLPPPGCEGAFVVLPAAGLAASLRP